MKKILLIIDDEMIVYKALSPQFSKEEVEILAINNGEDGLKMALEHHPDLILLDLVMPKMDGMTMLGKLREDEWGKKARVIVLTNISEADKIKEAEARDTYEFLVKANWDATDVADKIREALGL